MSWELLVSVAVLYQYGLAQVAIKKIGAVEGSRTRKLVWQYFFAAFFALVAAAFFGQLELSRSIAIVAAIGAANAFGCYCQWRAYDISMARTAMITQLDDLIAITLGYAILNEMDVLTPTLAVGIAVSIISAVVFARMRHPEKKAMSGRLIVWVLAYSVIWGVAMFSMRFFSVQGLSMLTFASAWYAGAWVGAMLTRYVIMGKGEAGPPLTRLQQSKVLLLAAVIWTSLMISYWMRELLPITIIQPIQLVAEMAVPVSIALVFFGEGRNMSRKELLVVGLGIVGVGLIAISF